ncbi:uncharacterized protein LOC113315516 [Papaver somniferum]|uniref:uncharacterized protein LOC113315516 n=1 Tax=Papaver somniferum TaxID=3469 RepID=UPI000E6FCB1D|nr:uncharacterized protein LOC113315516 [Papaver somniferum]
MTWNCRGAAKPSFVRVARDLISHYKPTIFVVLETRVGGDQASQIRRRLGYTHSLLVDSQGFSCGLWNKSEVDIQATSVSRWAIHAVVNVPAAKPWVLSSIYASNNPKMRHQVWNELKTVSDIDCPLGVIGGLNVLHSLSDKKGGILPTYSDINELNNVMNVCHLMDKKPTGPRFTWTSKQVNGRNIQERLDRLLINDLWQLMFPNAQVSHLHVYNSDHRVFMVDTSPTFKFRPRPFRIEAMWLQDIRFKHLVAQIWAQRESGAESSLSLAQKFRILALEAKLWNKSKTGS